MSVERATDQAGQTGDKSAAPATPKRRRKPPLPKCGAKTAAGTPCKQAAGARTDHLGEGKCWKHGGATPVKSGRYSIIKCRQRLRELLDHFEADESPDDLRPELNLLRGLITDYVERYDEQTEALIAWHASFGPKFSDGYAAWQNTFHAWRQDWEKWQAEFGAYRQSVEQVQGHYRLGWPGPPAISLPTLPPPPPEPTEFAQKPRQVLDILQAARFISDIGAINERIEKRQQEGAISLATLDMVVEQMGVDLVAAAQETLGSDESKRTALLTATERRWNTITLPGSSGRRGG